MQSSITKLVAGLLMLVISTVHAQQAANTPGGGNLTGPNARNQPEQRNPPVRLQPNQQGVRQRIPQRHEEQPNQIPDDQDQPQDGQGQYQNESSQQGNFGGGGYSSGASGRYSGMGGQGSNPTAELLRSRGDYNLNTAAAKVLHEQARGQAIDNRHKEVQNYFEVRQLNRQVSNDARGPMPTEDDRIRYNQSQFPARLPAMALDPYKGTIYWPAALMTPEFFEHRARLEQLFHARSKHNSGLASHNYLEIKDETDSMLITLQERVSERDPMAYLHAKKFIIGVGFEGRFVSDKNGAHQPLLR